jgi:hypothetical protein
VFLADGANLLRPNGFLQWGLHQVSFKHVVCHTIDYVTGIGTCAMLSEWPVFPINPGYIVVIQLSSSLEHVPLKACH